MRAVLPRVRVSLPVSVYMGGPTKTWEHVRGEILQKEVFLFPAVSSSLEKPPTALYFSRFVTDSCQQFNSYKLEKQLINIYNMHSLSKKSFSKQILQYVTYSHH